MLESQRPFALEAVSRSETASRANGGYTCPLATIKTPAYQILEIN